MAQLTVDDGYKNIQVWVDGQCIATEDIIDSVRISYGCTDGNSPAVGATFSPHCEVTINSNDGIDSLSQYLRLGKFFTILCELHEGTYTNMGAFHIIQPPMYTEDYDVTFSGEGLLGSVFDKTYVDYTLMQQYSDKGVITVTQALQIVEDMYQGLSIETPNESELPINFYTEARIVVPLKSTKWDKDVAYESRFIKITVREWLAGIAIMMGGNVIEYGNTFSIRSLNQPMTDDYFTEDDFVSDWRKEMQIYAPKSMYLRTYETTPVKKNNVVKGYCIKTECDCNSVYNPDLSGLNDAHKYDLFVDCQWIGRSFESYYFSGSIDGESGEYDKSTPRHTYPVFNTPIQYTPSEWEFSGWNDAFIPGNTFVTKCTVKNTETQQEEERNTKVFLMDMDWNWNGTITVGSSSSYGGDAERAELAIDDKDDSIAWNDRVVEPYEEIIPIPDEWVQDGFYAAYHTNKSVFVVCNGELHQLRGENTNHYNYTYNHYKYDKSINSWVSQPKLLTTMGGTTSSILVYKDNIYVFPLFTQQGQNYYYLDNNNTWVQCPIEFMTTGTYVINSATSDNNYIYVFFSILVTGRPLKLYKYDGEYWELINTVTSPHPTGIYSNPVMFNGELHTFRGKYYSTDLITHFKFNGTEWETLDDFETLLNSLDIGFGSGVSMYPIYYEGELHTVLYKGISNSKSIDLHYTYDGNTWTYVDDLTFATNSNCPYTVYDGKLHINEYNTAKIYSWKWKD